MLASGACLRHKSVCLPFGASYRNLESFSSEGKYFRADSGMLCWESLAEVQLPDTWSIGPRLSPVVGTEIAALAWQWGDRLLFCQGLRELGVKHCFL